jgi:hypothetical protein
MNSVNNMIAATALAGILSVNAVSASHAGDTWTVKPLTGISFDIGSKHAVSYYLSERGRCILTVVVADQMKDDDIPTDTPVRFNLAIEGGKDARLDTAEGTSLRFACAAHAEAMLVNEIDQVAVYADGVAK